MRPPFPRLRTMGREECEKFVAGVEDVCISIRSSRRERDPHLSANYRAVLPLVFDDIPWPSPPEGAVQISPVIADEVIRFVGEHLHAKRLVIHCDVGASRSVSMAMALAYTFARSMWRPRWLKDHDLKGRPAPNPIVWDAIVDAYDRHLVRI